MAVFTNWIKQAVNSIVDPEKEMRLAQLVQVLQHGLFQKKQRFVLGDAVKGLDYRPQDLELAKERVYRELLSRAWQDETLTLGEQQVAQWAAQVLQLASTRVRDINLEFAKVRFSSALARAMDDGVLDAHEEIALKQIASAVGLTLPDFARTYFYQQGEGFLRGIFAACVAENRISQGDWERLLATSESLGVSNSEMLQSIQAQARQFVEHVLADAKADNRLSEHEEAVLSWLLENLGLPPNHRQYVRCELDSLRALTRTADGRLPSLPIPSGVAIRAGEIVHFHGPSIWRRLRLLKSGPRTDDHRGFITMTDNRLIFTSPTTSQNVRFRSIVSYSGGDDRVELQTEGKPASTYFFADRSPLPFAIFCSAVAMVNQTLVANTESASTRFIPRDVRQRVWQRFGARCADCGAGDYLEFDHIIPVAKGGSNSDANVQLLCRRCNLKKSDHI